MEVEPIARADELPAAVQIFLGLVASGDAKTARVAARIHTLIFGDALDRLPARVRRLVIVPDAPLFAVPFDALRAGVDAPPLAQRFAIALAPSATTWWRLRRLDRPVAQRAALIYADPAGRSPWGAGSPGGAATREDGTLVPLPGSRREGRSASRALSGSSRVVIGADASETAFKHDGFGTYRILHFAAHAVLDSARPERTAVLLAPSDDDDGMLQVREIIDLPLSGQAVILSACESANGVLVPAEGLFGLTHAFVLAGARVVVANLWPVGDADAADFMGLVYEGLGRGLAVGEAVHRARVESIASGKPMSVWGGMVVVGDGDLVLDRGGLRVRWYHVASAALLSWSLGAWLWQRRRLSATPEGGAGG